MATRQQVLSLFGATPAQIQERQRQQQQEFLAAQRTPEQLAGSAIGLGLARLFGGKSPEMQAAEQMQQAIAGVDPNNPAALRELAQTVSQFAPERALQIAAYAGELEKSQRPSLDTFTEYFDVEVPLVDKFGEPVLDPETKQPIMTTEQRKRTRKIQDGVILPYEPITPPTSKTTATETIESQDTVINLGDDVSLVRPGSIEEARAGTQSTALQTASTAEPFVPQQGRMLTQEEFEAMEANTTGAGVVPRGDNTSQAVPSIARALPKGTPFYGDPEELSRASKAITQQIVALEKSKDKNKNAKLKILRDRRKELDRLRIASRRSGPPSDLRVTGKDSDVLSGFRNVK